MFSSDKILATGCQEGLSRGEGSEEKVAELTNGADAAGNDEVRDVFLTTARRHRCHVNRKTVAEEPRGRN